MTCDYFGKCGSCTLYDITYKAQVNYKKAHIEQLFSPFYTQKFDFFTSSCEHYRSRCEFRIWKTHETISYAMGGMDKKSTICIDKCPKVELKIYTLMPDLLRVIEGSLMLRDKLFAIEFLASANDLLVTLIYHKVLDDQWDEEAKLLEKRFGISVIGRSHKIRRVISKDFVEEVFDIEGKRYCYHIIEGGFSQPNRLMNQQMIAWVLRHLEGCQDLLELYCGYGNFTIPLSQKFSKVLATEISKTSIQSARKNCKLNDVSTIEFVRMSAEELTSALQKEREFRRLEGICLDDYTFSHVFVDPPRSGMDEKSLHFISQFETIIYISCNPTTLRRDLEVLTQTYDILHFALFDQFPHTEHLESGVVLKKKAL